VFRNLMEETVSLALQSEVMDCDLIAPWYAPVEHLCFGRALERRRTAFLGRVEGARNALTCGEGDGRFMAALLQSNSEVKMTAVDASRKMVQVAAQRVARMGAGFQERASLRCAEIGAFRPPGSYDLIATNFFFDCFSTSDVHDIIRSIADWAAPRTQWIVSEFAQPSDPVTHLWTSAVIRSLYAAFWVTTGLQITHLPEYRPALAAAGFELQCEEHACGGLLVSELWQRG
jgi:cyclopropane fatty-acyl-phospholipid synthase-like methyltransferase